MEKEQYEELLAMLIVVYKKLDELESKVKGGINLKSAQSYLKELRKEASKISIK